MVAVGEGYLNKCELPRRYSGPVTTSPPAAFGVASGRRSICPARIVWQVEVPWAAVGPYLYIAKQLGVFL